MLKPRKSIDDYGGLDAYLDDPEIMEKHGGYGSVDWHKNKNKGAAFCRDLFNKKSRDFWYDWMKRDKQEQNDGPRT